MTDRAIQAAWDAVRRTRSRDPARICAEMDIDVLIRQDFEQQYVSLRST